MRRVILARAAGVTLCVGGDVGVFAHGENAREIELKVAAGLPSAQALIDLMAVEGDPSRNIRAVRAVRRVMKGGKVYAQQSP